MIPIIAGKRSELEVLCRRFHVRRLELTGSAARGDFDPGRSDIDFVVDFGPDLPPRALEAYFGLKESLETLLNRRVDLIMAGAVKNPYVRAGMDRSRTTLYAA